MSTFVNCSCCGLEKKSVLKCNNCNHRACGGCYFGNICACHFVKVNNLQDLMDKIKNHHKKGYFYIGVTENTGKKFKNYVRQPVVCETKFQQKITTFQLRTCYFWEKSTNLESSEQKLLDFAYKKSFYTYEHGLNDEVNAKKRTGMSTTGTTYVRFYSNNDVKLKKK